MRLFKIGIVFLALIVFVLLLVINKPHRNINEEEAIDYISIIQLFSEFSDNESLAMQKYLDQTLEIKGVVTEINVNFLTLDDKIYCKFEHNIPQSLLNTNLKVKGRCIGFDELLEQIKLDQCYIQNK